MSLGIKLDLPERMAGGISYLIAALLLLGVAGPLLAILGKAMLSQTGEWIWLANFIEITAVASFWPAVINSLWVSIATTLIVLPLAYLFAAALTRSRMPGKGLFRYLALIPLLAPSLLPGISLVYLFGNQGLLKSWLPLGVSIYGPLGIVLGEAFYTFPHALMILLTALAIADARLYEAATSLGAGRIRQWFTVTLPAVRYGLISAGFVVFTLVMTDFGVPKLIGGQFNVLAVEAYKQVIGQQNFPKGAVIGLLLLLPAVLSFMVDYLVQQKALLTSRAQPLVPKPAALRDALALLWCCGVATWLLVMLGVAVAASLITLWPYNMNLTLAHFDFEQMDGGGWLAYFNSLKLAFWTAVCGVITVFTGAYLNEKLRSAPMAQAVLRVLAMLPMAVPGLVLGLGYVFFFNAPSNPLHGLYGTMSILVLCTVTHFYTTAHLTASTALKQMDSEFEAVAASLKVPFWKTLRRVTVPVCLPAILDIARYYFVSAMTTVSAVIFLYTPDTVLSSLAVLNMDDAGDTAAAAAMATLIVMTSALVCLLFVLASALLGKRSQAWRG
ncbi:putative 2-aminoethylphosphonate ABC transporter permease subunit [Iodobacter sp. CM08]|uniref:putative 2-aminoethylphosphonate ABC transporter permease subunit n=1 Tax=Iodobacter sp. CM08 TaxID=3085902 RepID=UPI002982A3E1|nr:putative 2-aminoethylphosphonate ABC transporter permease subunit [Iodobacter sp. CM08]MDW5416141.1 putative 2-aminoethylphosphonate ABC transporter permease subunit [Iodobacter sp. CM08]